MSARQQSILILHNPKSGSRHALDVIEALTSRLAKAGYATEAYDVLEQFQNQAQRLTKENRLRAVIAAGGDGTAAAVAARIDSTVPLWLCPLGTENLLARYLGMSTSPEQAVASIERLKTQSLDAGLANDRLFLIMVGIGFDAEVVRQVHAQRTGHIRRYHYWIPIARTAMSYHFPRLRFVSSSVSNSDEAAWYFLLNLPRYASGLEIAPDARGDDGLIDICGFKRSGLFSGIYYFLKLRFGSHAALADFSHHRASKFRIEAVSSEANPISYQLDGDWGGYLPLDVECLPGRLCVIEPVSDQR